MRQVRLMGHVFSPRHLDDPGRLVAAAISSAPYRFQAVVRFDVACEVLSRCVPPSLGLVEPYGESSLLRLGADEIEWLASYVLGLGLPFEVLEPPMLRSEMRELAERVTRSHTP